MKGDVSRVSSKSPSSVGDEGVAGRNEIEKYFPDEGSLIFPPDKKMIFFYKKDKKHEIVARPGP